MLHSGGFKTAVRIDKVGEKMVKNRFEIDWQDDEDLETKVEQEQEEFAELLEESASKSEADDQLRSQSLRVGEKVAGVVSYLGGKQGDVLVDLGGKNIGVLPPDGMSEDFVESLSVGDNITAYVQSSVDGEVVLTTSLSAGQVSKQALEVAYASKLPVRGKVVKSNKGGFEIELVGAGKRKAFCPVSQISNQFSQDPTVHVGLDYSFLITKLSPRDCVVSRRDLMQREASLRVEELKKIAADENHVLSSTVTEITPHGVVVDLGGSQSGFVHISELSHSRLEDPSEVACVGETLRVKVLSIDESAPKGVRVGLSVKAVLGDPWARESLGQDYPLESSRTGQVTRLATFGAFVRLEPGIEGLVHVSEMSWTKRISHPKEILEVGQKVQVRIQEIDFDKKRIALSLKDLSEDPWADVEKEFAVGTQLEAPVLRLEGFGAFIGLKNGVDGFLPARTLRVAFGDSFRKKSSPGASLAIRVLSLDVAERKILLGLSNMDHHEEAERAYREYQQQLQKKQAKEQGSSTQVGSFGDLLKQKMNKVKK